METVARTAIIYAVVLIVVRLSGRRLLSRATVFDLVLLAVAAEAAEGALVRHDGSLINAILILATLFCCGLGIALLRTHRPFRKVLSPHPIVLVMDGSARPQAMVRSRVSVNDILHAARLRAGITAMSDIALATLEQSGRISVTPKRGEA
jgi:uncharacterized membrane protein YcaP (DUF421 family)